MPAPGDALCTSEGAHRVRIVVGGHRRAHQCGFADELRDAGALAFGCVAESSPFHSRVKLIVVRVMAIAKI
jgi:hypothetical protein